MKKIRRIIKIDDAQIPIDIIREMRLDVRLSLLRDKAIMRIPIFFTKWDVNKNLKWAESWIHKKMSKEEKLKKRFLLKEYHSGDTLEVNDSIFTLNIVEGDVNNFTGKLKDKKIYIKVPSGIDKVEKEKGIKAIQSRIIGKYFREEITERIENINKKYFGVEINSIRLKYNKSNWGSRSSKNNINISTRLLFAPKDVQDYVFVHELAHFFEMNHSKKFWDIVEKVVPNYKEKEQWLKTNNHKCDF